MTTLNAFCISSSIIVAGMLIARVQAMPQELVTIAFVVLILLSVTDALLRKTK